MTNADVPHARPGLIARGLLLLAALAAGCSGADYGTVAASPKESPDAVQAAPPGKGAAPRVPRGPGQAKALQDAAAK